LPGVKYPKPLCQLTNARFELHFRAVVWNVDQHWFPCGSGFGSGSSILGKFGFEIRIHGFETKNGKTFQMKYFFGIKNDNIFIPSLHEKEKLPFLKENIQKCGSGSGPADQNKWIRIWIQNTASK
jgi:hypothetical protein